MSRSTRNPVAFSGIKGNQLFSGEDFNDYSLPIDILIFLNHFPWNFYVSPSYFNSIKPKV